MIIPWHSEVYLQATLLCTVQRLSKRRLFLHRLQAPQWHIWKITIAQYVDYNVHKILQSTLTQADLVPLDPSHKCLCTKYLSCSINLNKNFHRLLQSHLYLSLGSKPPWTIPNRFCSDGLLCATVRKKKMIVKLRFYKYLYDINHPKCKQEKLMNKWTINRIGAFKEWNP